MSGFTDIIAVFHFIRPWWLLALPVIALLWRFARRGATRVAAPRDGVAPHLRAALTVGAGGGRRFKPVDGVALVLALAAIGASGPTWSRQPDPFTAQTAPMVIALKVTPSMSETDVAPSRLERAKQKIRDLLQLRAGARTALVAYAGTAHRVVPMTDDPDVMRPYLEGLAPDVMPEEGANAGAAYEIAADMLTAEDAPGGVLFVLDEIAAADLPALEAEDGPGVAFLAMLPDGAADAGLSAAGARVQRTTVDEADIRALDRRLNSAYRKALAEEGTQPWDDRGWLLAWPAMALGLLWFRRGWTMRWAFLFVIGAAVAPPEVAKANGVADWFMTPDQQGRLAYQQKDYERAAELFLDPEWRARALYRAGQYEKSAEVYGRIETAAAAFAQGLAYIKARRYRDGVRSFETALERDPDYPGAAENLATAREIVDYVETAREQSDTGEDQGIGADDVVLDNEANRGADTEMDAGPNEDGKLLTAEQWMNTVDTRTGDFLRQRFATEAAQRK